MSPRAVPYPLVAPSPLQPLAGHADLLRSRCLGQLFASLLDRDTVLDGGNQSLLICHGHAVDAAGYVTQGSALVVGFNKVELTVLAALYCVDSGGHACVFLELR